MHHMVFDVSPRIISINDYFNKKRQGRNVQVRERRREGGARRGNRGGKEEEGGDHSNV